MVEERDKQLSPIAMLIEIVKVLEKRGELDLLPVYMQDLQMLMMQPPGGAGPSAPGAGGQPGQQQPTRTPFTPQMPPAPRSPEAKVNPGTGGGM